MWMIALQADLMCAPKFSACALKKVHSGATVLFGKIVCLEPCITSNDICVRLRKKLGLLIQLNEFVQKKKKSSI